MSDQLPTRRRFQFSLFLALLLLTLACVIASWIGWQNYRHGLGMEWTIPQDSNDPISGRWFSTDDGNSFHAYFSEGRRVAVGSYGAWSTGSYSFNPIDRTIKLKLWVDKGPQRDLEREDLNGHIDQDGALILGPTSIRLTRMH
jgi:hypothetical protein